VARPAAQHRRAARHRADPADRGNGTTRGLLAGAGQLLAELPDQRRLLVESPDLIPGRWRSPPLPHPGHACAAPLDDTEIRGQHIAKGDFLCLLYPAANRDEEVWSGRTTST
jgi:cytochrome P450